MSLKAWILSHRCRECGGWHRKRVMFDGVCAWCNISPPLPLANVPRYNPQNVPQPAVTHNAALPATWELVIADMKDRDRIGREKYGTPLQPCNGRDSLIDAYQEALDLVVYLRNEIEERKRKE